MQFTIGFSYTLYCSICVISSDIRIGFGVTMIFLCKKRGCSIQISNQNVVLLLNCDYVCTEKYRSGVFVCLVFVFYHESLLHCNKQSILCFVRYLCPNTFVKIS